MTLRRSGVGGHSVKINFSESFSLPNLSKSFKSRRAKPVIEKRRPESVWEDDTPPEQREREKLNPSGIIAAPLPFDGNSVKTHDHDLDPSSINFSQNSQVEEEAGLS